MKCPNCEIPLMMTERKGIEIDFCTQCRGIWLDRGELDKIIDISTQELNEATPEPISLKSEYRPAKSDKKRQYQREFHRDQDRDTDRDYDRDTDDDDRKRYRDHDNYRDTDKDRRYESKRYYKKQKSLLHTLLDIID